MVEYMKIDFAKLLINPATGKKFVFEFKEGKACGAYHPNLGQICIEALGALYSDERELSGNEKYMRGKLAAKIGRYTTPINLSSEEIALVKKLVGKMHSSIVVAAAWDLLENEDAKPKAVRLVDN